MAEKDQFSTAAKGGFVDQRNARGVMKRKPAIVVAYNSTMGGVDTTDAHLYSYLSKRRTMKWTHKLIFNLIGLGMGRGGSACTRQERRLFGSVCDAKLPYVQSAFHHITRPST
ncbi:PiggyBac transposable element-derived protein 4 [Plakobranchus ocellatus]|uniref:PiggyBac transposable element-derived protein 4 n=1 Tax=Plakobranchus ocellatus TaxID=259542 RepID=A0AAV4CLA2_9GAST|nr:PiggyBac transposable element-derived protein 4 [Plakobranchus ocellatus]